ncbi:MAG: hypothetical protein DCF27_09720 [Lysobacteraceae bacterium]|nr:MAG: hypothetical protein DCF27_09720 [Xanthomonadaceae bacterium]
MQAQWRQFLGRNLDGLHCRLPLRIADRGNARRAGSWRRARFLCRQRWFGHALYETDLDTPFLRFRKLDAVEQQSGLLPVPWTPSEANPRRFLELRRVAIAHFEQPSGMDPGGLGPNFDLLFRVDCDLWRLPARSGRWRIRP